MTAIAPQTDVYLLKVPLELDELNQLTFDSKEAQFAYFNSVPKLEADNFTYQRKDGVIRFPGLIDDILSYNYVMYRNEAYSDKWFYAFIVDMQYVNDNVTNIFIKSDTWQCWQFDLEYKPCLVEREHTNNDGIGVNLLPENVELGDFVVNGNLTQFGYRSDKMCLVVDVSMIENQANDAGVSLSYRWSDGQVHDPGSWINNVPNGVYHLIVGYSDPATTYRFANYVTDLYDDAGLGSAIINVYPMPKDMIGEVQSGLILESVDGGGVRHTIGADGLLSLPKSSFNAFNMGDYNFTRPSTIDGYTPHNRKLFSWPYCYCNVSNNAGTVIPYRYEDFASLYITFRCEGTFTPSGSFKAYPLDYKNILTGSGGVAYDYGVTGAKIPLGNWTSDAYTNWLTQNALNMKIEWAETILSGAGDVIGGYSEGSQTARSMMQNSAAGFSASQISSVSASAGAAGALAGAAGMAANVIGTAIKQYQRKTAANFVPDSAGGNLNTGDLTWARLLARFTYAPMSIKARAARIIDEFFDQFGYSTNRVKIPNVTGRRNWNFVKTNRCYIEADIPQTDLQEIKNMFDNGVTFWHNPATFADYTQNNDIIS